MTRLAPDRVLAIFSERTEERDSAISYLKKLRDASRKADQLIVSGSPPAALDSLVDDLYWSRRKVVTKTFDECDAGQWKHQAPGLRKFAGWLVKSIDNTKHVLEDVFGRLKDVLRSNANKRLSDFRAHFVAANAASLELTGSNVLHLPAADYDVPIVDILGENANLHKLQQRNNPVYSLKRGSESTIDLSPLLKPASYPGRRWQPAGPLAEKTQIGATHILVDDCENDFSNLSTAWMAEIFLKDFIFVRRSDNQVYLSLGGTRWSWMGVRLQTETTIAGDIWVNIGKVHDQLLNLNIQCYFFTCVFVVSGQLDSYVCHLCDSKAAHSDAFGSFL